jgi:hypothetical protein
LSVPSPRWAILRPCILNLPAPFLTVCASSCRSRTLHPCRGLRDVRHFRLLRYWHRLALRRDTRLSRNGLTLFANSLGLSCPSKPVLPVQPVQTASNPQENQGLRLYRFLGMAPGNRYTCGTQPVQLLVVSYVPPSCNKVMASFPPVAGAGPASSPAVAIDSHSSAPTGRASACAVFGQHAAVCLTGERLSKESCRSVWPQDPEHLCEQRHIGFLKDLSQSVYRHYVHRGSSGTGEELPSISLWVAAHASQSDSRCYQADGSSRPRTTCHRPLAPCRHPARGRAFQTTWVKWPVSGRKPGWVKS